MSNVYKLLYIFDIYIYIYIYVYICNYINKSISILFIFYTKEATRGGCEVFAMYVNIYTVFTTKRFFKIVIKSWSEWDLYA